MLKTIRSLIFGVVASTFLEAKGIVVIELGQEPKEIEECSCTTCRWDLNAKSIVAILELMKNKWYLKFIRFFKGATVNQHIRVLILKNTHTQIFHKCSQPIVL
jgi:hypothetical protein